MTSKGSRTSCQGARKAALLLSILDPETAAAILGLFEPEVARRIAEEAKLVKVDRISEKDVEPIVDEFVRSFGLVNPNLTNVLLGEAKRTVEKRRRETDNNESSERFGVLGTLSEDSLASALEHERPTVAAAILSRLPGMRRKKVADKYPSAFNDSIDFCRALLAEKQNVDDNSPIVDRLEKAIWESVLENE